MKWLNNKLNIALCIILSIILILLVGVVYNIKPDTDCHSYLVDVCPSNCVICPPCPECSSISCETEDFCNANGFNKSWYDSVRPKF
jgi:hypothetical protein